MALTSPEIALGSYPGQGKRLNRVRLARELTLKGRFQKHEIEVSEGRDQGAFDRGTRARLIWPRWMLGAVAIDIYEEAVRLVPSGRKNELYTSAGAEQGDVASPLARVLLARDYQAKGELVYHAQAQQLYDAEGDLFEGALLDITFQVYVGADTSGKPEAEIVVKGVPIMKPNWGPDVGKPDTDHFEGPSWELGLRLRYLPGPHTQGGSLRPKLLEGAAWDALPLTSTSYQQLPYLRKVSFRVEVDDERGNAVTRTLTEWVERWKEAQLAQLSEEEREEAEDHPLSGQNSVRLDRRYVFALHATRGCKGEDDYLLYRAELLIATESQRPYAVEAQFLLLPVELKGFAARQGEGERRTRKRLQRERKRGLRSLAGKRFGAPDALVKQFSDGCPHFIDDIVVLALDHPDKPADGVRTSRVSKDVVWRNTNAYSWYWLLPEDFETKRAARISDCDRKGLVVRRIGNTRHDRDYVTFKPPSEWDVYRTDCLRILRHLALLRLWQARYARFQAKHEDELYTWTRVVKPVTETFAKFRFKSHGSTPGGFNNKRFAQVERKSVVLGTEAKLRRLAAMEAQMRSHVGEALRIFSKSEFQRVFYAKDDPYLGQNHALRQGPLRERHSSVGSVALEGITYRYDDALKLRILTDLSANFVLLAQPPELDPERGATKAGRLTQQKKNLERMRRRQRAFRALAFGLRELLEVRKGEYARRPRFLARALDEKRFWAVLNAAGWLLYVYASPGDRELFGAALTAGQEFKGGDLLNMSDADWSAFETAVNASAKAFSTSETIITAALPKTEVFDLDGKPVLSSGVAEPSLGDQVGLTFDLLKFVISSANIGAQLKGDPFRNALELTDYYLSGIELMLKTARMISPTTFDGIRILNVESKIVMDGLGKVLKMISILKELHDIYMAIWGGDEVDAEEIFWSAMSISITAISFVASLATVAAVLAIAVLFVQAVIEYEKVSEFEAPLAWFCRTPWGNNIYWDYTKRHAYEYEHDVDYDGSLHWEWKPGTAGASWLFREGVHALSRFLGALVKQIDEDDDEIDKSEIHGTLSKWFTQWCRQNARHFKMEVEIDTTGYKIEAKVL